MSAVHRGPGRSAAKERTWQKHITDQSRSGLTALAYCEAHGLSEHSFYDWRHEQLGQRDLGAKPSAPQYTEAPFAKTQFAEVVLTGAGPVASSVLQIHLPSHFLGARIEVFAGCDRTSLEMALAALRPYQRSRRADDFFDAQALNSKLEFGPINFATIAMQIEKCGVVWKGFYHLLGGPARRRMSVGRP